MFSEQRQFHFSSVILSYFLLSSSKEERELEREADLILRDYVREELGERSFVRHYFQPYCPDQYATIGSALSELRGQ